VTRRAWGGGLLLIIAAILLVAAGLLLLPGRSGSSARPVPIVNTGNLPAVPSPPASGPSAASAVSRPVHDVHGSVPAGSRLGIARLNVDATIRPVGTDGNVMQVPLDPKVLGWWRDGSAPGDAAGNTVIVGHVNYAGVTGALAVLPDTRPGDQVSINENGTVRRFRIIAVRTYAKTSGIPASVFTRVGPPQLVLITCGGPFDRTTGNYEDNIVAYAEPV
jgi:hypothetical protein